jgi:ribonuclease HI
MNSTQKIGDFWKDIQRYQHWGTCQTCNTTESMEHILIHCNERAVRIIWELAKQYWPHNNIPLPEISLGTVLGCGSITIPRQQGGPREPGKKSGPTRLLQILISESAHLIWAIRCERVIQIKNLSAREIKAKWLNAINRRLIEDRIIATKIKRDKESERKVKHTWEAVLKKSQDLPNGWIQD